MLEQIRTLKLLLDVLASPNTRRALARLSRLDEGGGGEGGTAPPPGRVEYFDPSKARSYTEERERWMERTGKRLPWGADIPGVGEADGGRVAAFTSPLGAWGLPGVGEGGQDSRGACS